MTTELRKTNFVFNMTCWMIATFLHLSNVLNSGLSFFFRSGALKEYLSAGQRSAQRRNRTCSDSFVYDAESRRTFTFHIYVTSLPSSLFTLVWCMCVFQVPVQVSAATLPSSLKRGASAWAQRTLLLTQTPTCPSENLPRVKPVRTTGRNPRSNACPPGWMLWQLIELTVLLGGTDAEHPCKIWRGALGSTKRKLLHTCWAKEPCYLTSPALWRTCLMFSFPSYTCWAASTVLFRARIVALSC